MQLNTWKYCLIISCQWLTTCVTESAMLHWLKLKYIRWDWGILSKTEILYLRLRYFVWDQDTLSETKIHCLRLTNYYCLCNSIAHIASPLVLYFSPAINSFPPSRLLNSLAIHSITLALLPLLPKSLSLSTAHLSSALIHYNHFNPHLLRLSIATLTSQPVTTVSRSQYNSCYQRKQSSIHAR